MREDHAGERDDREQVKVQAFLLVILATGVIDAACLLHLGVFTAYVTGSFILFGAHLVGIPGSPWPNGCAIVAFVVGAFGGARLVRRELGVHRLYGDMLLVDAVLVLAASLIAAFAGLDGDGGRYATIAVLAVAMGVQLAVIRHAAVPDLLMAAGTVVLFNLLSDTKAAGGTPKRTGRRLGVIAGLVVGAAIGAGIARWQPWAAWTAAAAILAAAAGVTYRQFPRDPVLRSD